MNIVIAPDSFKDALSARDAAAAIAAGLKRELPDATLHECPMGDGGEGTLDALLAATGAERRMANVQDALGREATAAWGWRQPAAPLPPCSTARPAGSLAPSLRRISTAACRVTSASTQHRWWRSREPT